MNAIRRAIPISAALLALGCAILWPRSYRVTEFLSYTSSSVHPSVRLHSHLGHLYLSNRPSLFGWCVVSQSTELFRDDVMLYEYDVPVFRLAGVRYLRDGPYWALGFPYPLLISLLSIPPLLALIRRRRNRHAAGHCPRCDYDLRATPDRCPECGGSVPLLPLPLEPRC